MIPTPGVLMASILIFTQTLLRAIKAFQLYAPGHPRHREFMTSLEEITRQFMEGRNEIQIGALHDRLFLDKQMEDIDQLPLRTLARLLEERAIRILVLYPGITGQELGTFLTMLSMKPGNLWPAAAPRSISKNTRWSTSGSCPPVLRMRPKTGRCSRPSLTPRRGAAAGPAPVMGREAGPAAAAPGPVLEGLGMADRAEGLGLAGQAAGLGRAGLERVDPAAARLDPAADPGRGGPASPGPAAKPAAARARGAPLRAGVRPRRWRTCRPSWLPWPGAPAPPPMWAACPTTWKAWDWTARA